MGEPAAAEAATSERDVLLATKLTVPGLRADLVPRPRLALRLDEGRGRGLVLACAPAGYGKTVLLAEWVRRGRAPAAWLSLDAGDNDPARFWRHAVAALDRVRPGISERMGPLLGPHASPSFEPLMTALINEVAGQPDADEALLLVLDDYHVISSQLVHSSLGFLLEHQPPGLRLALTSRSDPPLALARLRARGQLTELRAAELRFTPGEAAALLAQVAAAPGGARPGAPLPEAVAATLAARTEGWAAGLQLAGLSLRGRSDVDGFVAAFTGSHRYVLDYLAEEVLEHQSEQVRTFLLETSVLERLSGALCDAVTGRPGSQALLEGAERAGLFLIPLDEVRGWWRYHHLFADLLRTRLQAEQPGRVPGLHRNAAAWYAERGLADDAIRHAVAAGEMSLAARLIEQHFDAVHSLRGEAATVQRWLTPLPADLVRSRPRLLLAQAVPAATGGRLEAAEQLVAAAEVAYAGPGEEPFEPTIGRAGSLLVNVPAMIAVARGYLAQLRGDARGTAEFGSQALAESREDEWILRSVAQGQLAVAQWLDGRLDDAERAFAHGIAGRRAAGLATWEAWESYELGQVQLAQGRLDAAVRTCEQALEAVADTGQALLPTAGPAHAGLAEVAYQRHELGRALDYVTQGIALSRSFVYTMPLAAGLATLAWIRQAGGDPPSAGSVTPLREAGRAPCGAEEE
jgi:LuxR family maltose regulon positive regulatory protein